MEKGIRKEPFGLIENEKVHLYTLYNNEGSNTNAVTITEYGARITKWNVPDRQGNMSSIVLGYDNVKDYAESTFYPGATIGRCANLIENAEFCINTRRFSLSQNFNEHHLHGGYNGFDRKIWKVVELNEIVPSITLYHCSADGEEGYPGNLEVTVTFTLEPPNTLCIEYRANTDQPTIVNLTNHSYFNLAGNTDENVLNHELKINADSYTEVLEKIATGNMLSVIDSAYDFRNTKTINDKIDQVGMYNINYVLNKEKLTDVVLASVLSEKNSGRRLATYTNMPGLQLYTNNGGICLETQHLPNAPNVPYFPSTLLIPGQTYYHITKYAFSLLT